MPTETALPADHAEAATEGATARSEREPDPSGWEPEEVVPATLAAFVGMVLGGLLGAVAWGPPHPESVRHSGFEIGLMWGMMLGPLSWRWMSRRLAHLEHERRAGAGDEGQR